MSTRRIKISMVAIVYAGLLAPIIVSLSVMSYLGSIRDYTFIVRYAVAIRVLSNIVFISFWSLIMWNSCKKHENTIIYHCGIVNMVYMYGIIFVLAFSLIPDVYIVMSHNKITRFMYGTSVFVNVALHPYTMTSYDPPAYLLTTHGKILSLLYLCYHTCIVYKAWSVYSRRCHSAATAMTDMENSCINK